MLVEPRHQVAIVGPSRCRCFDVAHYFNIIFACEFPTGGYPGGCSEVSKCVEVCLEQFSWEADFEGTLLVVDSEEVAGEGLFMAVVEEVDESVNPHGGIERWEADSQGSCWSEDYFSVCGIADVHGF